MISVFALAMSMPVSMIVVVTSTSNLPSQKSTMTCSSTLSGNCPWATATRASGTSSDTCAATRLIDAEALLLVDDDETQILELDALAEQPVGPDHDIHLAAREPLDRLLRLLDRLKAAERAQVHRESGEPLGEGLHVLAHQQRGRHQQGDLLAILHRLERGPHGDFGLAVSDVARDQAVHRDGALHVGFDLVDGRQLVGGLDERERLFQLALPRGVRGKGVALARHARAVELDQLDGDVAHRLARLALGCRPVRSAHLAERRALTADVAGQQVE